MPVLTSASPWTLGPHPAQPFLHTFRLLRNGWGALDRYVRVSRKSNTVWFSIDLCSLFVLNVSNWSLPPMLNQAFPFKVVRASAHDEFRRRADECRRLAAFARNAKDRAFWLGLVARWQTLEGQIVQQHAPTPPPPARAGGKGGGRSSPQTQANCQPQAISIDILGGATPSKASPRLGRNMQPGRASRSAKRRKPF